MERGDGMASGLCVYQGLVGKAGCRQVSRGDENVQTVNVESVGRRLRDEAMLETCGWDEDSKWGSFRLGFSGFGGVWASCGQ